MSGSVCFSPDVLENSACLITVQLVAHLPSIRYDGDNQNDDDDNNTDDDVGNDDDAICPAVCIEKGKTEQKYILKGGKIFSMNRISENKM